MLTTIKETDQIDVQAGKKCTYGQMVELGRVLDNAKDRTDVETIRGIIRVLHPGTEAAINLANVKYTLRIADAVRFWREKENTLLKYVPSNDEKAAGYENLAKLTGPTGVASTIAEKFGVHGGPDEVFEWPYATVFMVLYIDLERYKFQKRLQDIRDRKRKQNGRKWQRR